MGDMVDVGLFFGRFLVGEFCSFHTWLIYINLCFGLACCVDECDCCFVDDGACCGVGGFGAYGAGRGGECGCVGGGVADSGALVLSLLYCV